MSSKNSGTTFEADLPSYATSASWNNTSIKASTMPSSLPISSTFSFSYVTLNFRTFAIFATIAEKISFLISYFRRVVKVVFFLLGDSPASDIYVPKFRNTLSVPSSEVVEYDPFSQLL